jgi:ubiquinone/menaquinone biosynthesis C-methylase UbiE
MRHQRRASVAGHGSDEDRSAPHACRITGTPQPTDSALTDSSVAGGRRSPLLAHYATGCEATRLAAGPGLLERIRTEEIIGRYLPVPPAMIVDVGGGPGTYAAWLASRGYTVQLLDVVPLHVEQARQRFEAQGLTTARAGIGDARELPYAAESADVVLLLGPLYHLPAREDRLLALREAWRVVRPGGQVMVAAISRFASLLDGFFRGFVRDPVFRGIIEQDLGSGRHENPGDNPVYFTTAYFHHPGELPDELQEAGFRDVDMFGVEGPFWCLPDLDEIWSSDELRQSMLVLLRVVERDRSLIGASAHLLAHATK